MKDSRDLVIEGLLRRLARMQQLLIVSRILNETLDLRTLLQYIMETAVDLTRTEASSILLFDPKTEQLRFAASTSIRRGELENLPVPMESSIAGWIFTAGKPMIISDVRHSPLFYEGVDVQTGFHTRSIMGAPLEVKGRKIGVLEVVNKIGDAPFTDDDMEVLTILAAQAAVSIENARLFEQSDLISDVVHELRTPLTSIIGYSKMFLMAESLPAELQRQFASTIHREASRLGDMVNNYLDLARLESGRAKLKRQETDLVQIIQDAVHLMEPQARERDIVMDVKFATPTCLLVVDAERMRQALVNVLSNAIKYNRQGGSVTITLDRADAQVIIAVQDTGQGIDPAHIGRIFDKFYRGEEQEGQAKGTGLGLSIVKQIVEMHGGRIEVQSTLGVGSTFTITLPARPS